MPKRREGFAAIANAALIDELYARFCQDPTSVDFSWRAFFDGFELALAAKALPKEGKGGYEYDAVRIYHMRETFRTYGHLASSFNPLFQQAEEAPQLTLKSLRFSQEELERLMPTCGFLPEKQAPLSKIYEALKSTYSGHIGIEFMDQSSEEVQAWIQQKIEPFFPISLDAEERHQILADLYRAEVFEVYLHTKYVGQKRFSLEGAETLIPMLERVIDKASDHGVQQTLLGMAHRGRLNVLANVLNKSYALIFHEFEDHYSPDTGEGSGDVKYHKGFYAEIPTLSKKTMGITLVANPSHLESVDPVVLGSARAVQMTTGCKNKEVLSILIHGDASIAGQGVVYETLQLSSLSGYATGGTLHIIVNNQIGFTTVPKDARSTQYCSDIAKAFHAPVFHVNAERPEECVYAIEMALELRQKFSCDVFIDLVCYRKYGHNEGDEPSFTQPLEYQLIKEKKTILTLYREELEKGGILSLEEWNQLEEKLKSEFHKASQEARSPTSVLQPRAAKEKKPSPEVKTGVASDSLRRLSKQLADIPPSIEVHPKVQRLLQERVTALEKPKEELVIDWGTAETLAYATLLEDGIHVRISGQDSRRGTFSHRHALVVDQTRDQKYFPLSHLPGAKALFDIYNSPLSEFAVMGFEYGYSLVYRNALVIWEAQFGDFANGAQVIIDQYLASSEQKWGAISALTLMLPHGYEGQGPEHSSARMERYLQLSADDNIRVANPTTPAQLFHLLRLQALDSVKKPLIIFTPKALLRHPLVLSSLQTLEEGSFEPLLKDPLAPKNPRKLLFCSGKVYYDLFAERKTRGKTEEIALIRMERLYPFPLEELKSLLQTYTPLPPCVWVQEEPANMGAHMYIQEEMGAVLETMKSAPLQFIGRASSASTAAGSYALHKKQYAAFIEAAFN